ncbi:MAG: cell division protein ZapE [Pseudomonadota bacterium]
MNTRKTPGPYERYQHQVDSGQLIPDMRQRELADLLDERFRDLTQAPRPWWQRWRSSSGPVKGLYLHGQVGRGKTMLMDLLADSLYASGEPVWRIHFHRFMAHVHDRLAALDQQRNPLTRVAQEIASQARTLCLDEFHVTDIGDAMILAELLHQLFELDVALITTSNTQPSQLYADGLQRARFLPAIDLIERHCDVLALDAREDYRLRELTRHPVFYWPEAPETLESIEREFQALAACETAGPHQIDVRGRSIDVLNRAGSLAWFTFEALCEGPRAAADYIELARRFSTMMISGVPVLDDTSNDAARRFIHLIDECYDRSVKLIISAADAPERLYQGTRLQAPFERTSSRLIEMQSHDYLAQEHKP